MAKGMAKKEWQQDTAGIPRSSSPLPFVLPLVIFLMIASRYPDFASEEEPDTILRSAQWYLGMIALQVVLAVGALVYFRKIYLQHFPFQVSIQDQYQESCFSGSLEDPTCTIRQI